MPYLRARNSPSLHRVQGQFVDKNNPTGLIALKVIKPASLERIKTLKANRLDLVQRQALSPPSVISLQRRHEDLLNERMERINRQREARNKREVQHYRALS